MNFDKWNAYIISIFKIRFIFYLSFFFLNSEKFEKTINLFK